MPEQSANSQNQIEQRLAELPQDVRDVVLSAQLGEHLREIGQRHGLHIDQVGVLEDEAMLVMLGFFEPEEFSNQIATQLRISSADADAITKEVNEQVFFQIRESMKKFAESKRSVKPMAESAAVPAIVSAPTNIPIRIETPQGNGGVSSAAGGGDSSVSIQAKPPAPPMPNAEKMLTETTVAKPVYKADPYREPIEP